MTDFGVKKMMAIAPAGTPGTPMPNSTHKFVCGAYCPTDDGAVFESIATIGDGKTKGKDRPKDLGQASVTQPASIGGETKTCEHWQWTETLFGLIPMSKSDFYVDRTGASPVPFYSSQVIEPFGGAPIGVENTSFVGFTPMDVEKGGYFDIDPDSIAHCPINPQGCGQNNKERGEHLHRALQEGRFAKSIASVAEEKARALGDAAAIAAADPPPPPKIAWPKDWSAVEDARMAINQGGETKANGDICCVGNPGQCQIQFEHQAGTRFFDLSNQRERFEDSISGQVTVTDYAAHKDMLINVTAGVETCQEYCPIDPQDTMGTFDPFDPFDTVKDKGETSYKGKKAHWYEWSDVIFKILKMQTSDFFVDDSAPATPKPIALNTALSPFGIHMGAQNNTWAQWTPGKQPAAKFTIAGVAACPMSSKCQQGQHQASRARRGDWHTFYRYMRAPIETSAAAH